MITAWIGSLLFLVVSILYILLALGLPYGDLAMSGKHKVMAKPMRIACAFSVIIQWFAILCILQAGNVIAIGAVSPIAKGACYFFAFYLIINTAMNVFSKSKKEKLVMTPLSMVTAACFFITALNA
ncbi:hypothetical protein [Cohnella lupini]|uniref:DoxX-like protein n=1 Tax=Cohnella lupini TaxID=1294267 RepID=A0A3D9HTS4_9BACL|nr:hypothetical protein [Cohnella lupini]RED52825.1 hypothetical protein DFP95_13032 [Cohnella lupini]